MARPKEFDVDAALQSALEVFWEKGYEATSMQDLVDAMGIQRASLYATYGDKHALFLASLRMFADTVHHQRLADLEATHGPREAIRQSLLAFVPEESARKRARGCFLTNTALELAAHDPEAGRVVAHAQKQTEAWYARLIKKGKALGEIAPSVKPAEAASALLACLIGVSVLSRSRPERVLLHAIVDDAMRRLA